MTITVWLATAEPVLTGDFVKNEETFRCCGGRFRFMAGWGGGVKEEDECFTLIWLVLAPPAPTFSNVFCSDERLLVEHSMLKQTR